MPISPLKPCAFPSCTALIIPRDQYCTEHKAKVNKNYELNRETAVQRGYNTRWKKIRKMVLLRDPICKDCNRNPSTNADHIIAVKNDGSNNLNNLKGLCQSCHSKKTASEDGGFGNVRRNK